MLLPDPDIARRKAAFVEAMRSRLDPEDDRLIELADHTGIARHVLQAYRDGHSLPAGDNLIKLAKALGLAPEELLPSPIRH